jgi:hypothetical protein
MKQLTKKDLINGEIYICIIKRLNIKHLIKKTNNFTCVNIEISPLREKLFTHGCFTDISNEFYEATPEEKHWLEVCIAANSFISYDKAMKTFIPKYVKAISNKHSNSEIIGKIYKTSELPKSFWDCYMIHYKPSTKEVYDAQFIVKEPEFVLSENWYIIVKDKNKEIDYYKKYFRSTWSFRNNFIYGFKNGKITNAIKYGQEITFEQFKKYVLKEQLEIPKDKVLKLNTLKQIQKVQCSEGAIYQLGDKITVFTKDSPNKGRILNIKGFRWNNAKTNICAITEVHAKNGIGLDKIELHSEPIVKKLSLLEQAKLKYPIGIKFKNACKYRSDDSEIFEITSTGSWNQSTIESHGQVGVYFNNQWLYFNNQWAEIVEDFKLPETWWITIENQRQLEIAKQYFSQHFNQVSHLMVSVKVGYVRNNYGKTWFSYLSETTNQSNPQITFEQFEQYVLHNGFKIGDKFNKVKALSFTNHFNNISEGEIIDLQYLNNKSVAFYKVIETNHSGPQCRILTKNIVK